MKKVGTITTHGALNYGAVLQAYALSKYICDLGVHCEVMDYCPPYVAKSYSLVKSPKKPSDVVLMLFQMLYLRQRKARRDAFEAFREKWLPLSKKKAMNRQELTDLANQYDLLVCGSDQIWNPDLHDFDESYFLSYPEIEVPRVSYAASFGQDTISQSLQEELKRRLSGFSAFACREYTAKKVVEQLTGRKAQMVLDPVFLLSPEEWRHMARPCGMNENYVLAYFLSNPGNSPFAAKKYAEQHHLKTLSVGFSPRDFRYGIRCNYSLGPQEFLGAIMNAETILTNSFHCTAFAILFKKDFYVRVSQGTKGRNDRLYSLLKNLGLENRIYTEDQVEKLDLNAHIDYPAIQSQCEKWVRTSQECLAQMLTKGK